jgi:hypothetical protein
MEAIAQAFQKQTGIEVNYWRLCSKVIDRALSEYRAGRPLFDAILTNSNPMQILEKDGSLLIRLASAGNSSKRGRSQSWSEIS